MNRFLVLTTPGTDDAELERGLDVLRTAAAVDVARTEDRADLDRVLDDVPDADDVTLVVAGGDGSAHAVVAALHDRGQLSDTRLGLLPLGTGNDFARGNGIPLDVAEAAEAVLAGREQPMDLIVDDAGGIVVNSVHLGAGADAARRAERWKERLGRVGYPIGALLTAVRPPALRLRVEVDGNVCQEPRSPVLQVAIGNGPQVGGGTELVPEAHPRDGRLDVVISLPVGLSGKAGYALDLLRGRHHQRGDVVSARGGVVSVSGDEFWATADGETYGPVRQRTWRIQRAAYTMLLP